MRLARTPAFWLFALILGLLLFASSVPSPLYPVYQAKWGFSAITLTSVFGVYALALLVALLTVGSISDHIGRRPTIAAALALEVVAMLVFAEADAVGWLFLARSLQGVATGTAMGALSAGLLDLQGEERPWLGALMGVVAPLSGLALGALGAGLLVQYGPDPTAFTFWLLTGGFALAALAVLAAPETIAGDGEWRSSLRPRIGVPQQLRGAFVASLPSLAATWALGGLILSLGASVMVGVLDQSSHVAGGLPIFILAGVSAVTSILARDLSPRVTARGGLGALIAGLVLALVALTADSTALFLVASGVCGIGFGPAFAGVFRLLTMRAPADQRASLTSSIFAVSYVAFSVPAVAAGVAVTQVGLRDTTEVYGVVLIGLAALALVLSGALAEAKAPGRATLESR